ncbi:nucleoside diphosphate kinase regulator [Roseiconus lacunae]|uniref:Nucleoside diphosphate kinase regulator n=1 Tax=Roseiconus lacunae TaxID=2605694 RepID=A0ABT7PE49_9BACT|nr:nucleoside diphosphate kinase regulator [Roseiconus lacunae]MDM4014772.1 nucleoside diphosphate kinase regulator [Roseiconus lacunae]
MASRKIIVTFDDYTRLSALLADKMMGMIADRKLLRDLASELQHAEVIESSKVPGNVVTMNSIVVLTEIGSGETDRYTLVYPEDANIAEGRLSVFAPVGTAILGYRVGDLVRWNVPSGTIELRIDAVTYQPERDAMTA